MQRSQQILNNQQSPIKRRGRPEKKSGPSIEDGEQLFTIHDNVFHASILFYTFRVFDKAPTRSKFNPTIGYSIYQKVKGIPQDLRKYYEDDSYLKIHKQLYQGNYPLQRFFINSLTFGPKCVINQFYGLFEFILTRDPTLEQTIQFVKLSNYKYLFLEAKTTEIKEKLNKVIEVQHVKLLEIILYTLNALKRKEKNNKYAYILDTQEELFERGVNSKPKKKIKKELL